MRADNIKNIISNINELPSHMSSDKTKKIYQEEIESMKKFLIETYVEYLQNTTHGKKAYEYSRKLRNYYGNSSYHDIIVSERQTFLHGKLHQRNLSVPDLMMRIRMRSLHGTGEWQIWWQWMRLQKRSETKYRRQS